MEILKDSGSFLILTPEDEILEQLLRIEKAGRTCYQSEVNEVTLDTATRFIRMLIKRGHESVLEHSNITVQFTDISRGFTHELVRHRLASYSQESTRYVDYCKEGKDPDLERFQLKFVVPPHRDENEKVLLEDGRMLSTTEMFAECEKFYRALRKQGWQPQDARQILPIGTKSQIVISANFREWRHIFAMRTNKAAHWEIRKVIGDLLDEFKRLIPVVFDDFVEAGVDQNGLRYFEKRAL